MITITEMRCPEKQGGQYPECEKDCQAFKEKGGKACEKIFAEEEWNGLNPCEICGQHTRVYVDIKGVETTEPCFCDKEFWNEHDHEVKKLEKKENEVKEKFWKTFHAIKKGKITEWNGVQLSGQIGGIYPPDRESSYDQANLRKCICVEVGGGHFYAEIAG